MSRTLRALGCLAALAGAIAPALGASAEVRFLYSLSDFDGTLPLYGARFQIDDVRDETVVLDAGTVRIFTPSGMETYSFPVDPSLGGTFDIAVDASGDILLATTPLDREPGAPRFAIHRFDYRGELKESITPDLPAALADFIPNFMALRDGEMLYFLSPAGFRVVVLRTDGTFVKDIDLAPALEITDSEREAIGIGGFGFDRAGNMLLTVPERFRAFVLSPDGTVRGFGRLGSGPGRFGVAGGITGDANGFVYVADQQRSVVMVFDEEYRFLTEFGDFGDRPENLIRPQRIGVAAAGKVLVSQLGERGISVFALTALP